MLKSGPRPGKALQPLFSPWETLFPMRGTPFRLTTSPPQRRRPMPAAASHTPIPMAGRRRILSTSTPQMPLVLYLSINPLFILANPPLSHGQPQTAFQLALITT